MKHSLFDKASRNLFLRYTVIGIVFFGAPIGTIWSQVSDTTYMSLIHKADSLDDQGLYAKSLNVLSEMKNAYPSLSPCEYGILNANLYNRLIKYDSALYLYKQVLASCDSNIEKVYAANHGIAYTYRMIGKLDSSYHWEYKALNAAEQNQYQNGINLSLQSLAILSYSRSDYQQSNQQAFALISYLDLSEDLSLAGNMFNLVGVNYRNIGELDSALHYHEKALAFRRQTGNNSRVASSLNNMAAIHLSERNGNAAMPMLKEAIEIKELFQDSVSLVTLYSNLGNAYYLEKQFKDAKTYFGRAAQLAEKIRFKEGQLENLKSIIALDSVQGDFKSAYSNLSNFVSISDQYLNEQKQNEILELEKRYESEKKEVIISQKEKELSTKNFFIAVIIGFLLVVVLVSFYLVYLLRKNQKLSTKNELLLKEQNHRVKNNLQMISSLLSLQSQKLLSTDAKEALTDSQARVNSVALLHRMLYEGEQVGFVDVVQYLKSLTEEVKYASHRELEVQLEVTEGLTLKVERATSLGLILNELMTNSIKHAETSNGLILSVAVKESEGQIMLSYQDNGEGMDIAAWESSNSFGNQLIKIQSEQMNGQVKISSNNGFNYQLKLKIG